MHWLNNEFANNVKYGLDPHDDSDYLDIENNYFHDNGDHGLICSQRCDHLTITNNVSSNNTGNGIMIHRNVTDSLVANNTVTHNTDSGIAVFDSHNNTITGNTSLFNEKGIRLSVGASGNTISNNEFGNNSQYGIYLYEGSDPPTINDGRPKFNTFSNNNIHDNADFAIKLSDSDNNEFQGNQFTNNGSGILFVGGVSNRLDNNTIPPSALVATDGDSSTAGSTFVSTTVPVLVTVDSVSSVTFQDSGGRILDPEELNGAATITTGGSSITLTSALIGSQSLVTPLNFWVTVPSGTLSVRPTQWQTSGQLNRDWVVQATSPGQTANYTIGSLAAGGSYLVLKNGLCRLAAILRRGLAPISWSHRRRRHHRNEPAAHME